MPIRRKRPWKGVKETKRAQVSKVNVDHVIEEKHRVYHTKEINVTRLPPEIREKVLESPEEITEALRKVMAEKEQPKKEKEKPKHEFADIPFPPGKVYTGKGKDVHTLYNLWSKALNNQLKMVKTSIESAQKTLKTMEDELREKRHGKYVAKTLGTLFKIWSPSEIREIAEHPIRTMSEGAIGTRWKIRRLRAELEIIARHREEWVKLYERELQLLKEAYEKYKEDPTKENAERFAKVLRKIIEMNAELQQACTAEAFTRWKHWRFFKDGFVDKQYYKRVIAYGKRLRKDPKYIPRLFAAAFAELDRRR
ncbi:MAG: hypothetical protein J7J87_00320 [Candidatus Diapherotrites archaeon]|nr:hypothetical protein [Candidatus Diapherotrites archaeon]